MDFVDGALSLTASSSTSGTGGNLLEYVIAVGVATAVLRLEVTRRSAGLPGWSASNAREGYSASCKKLIRLYAPEATGLVACLVLAATLRCTYNGQAVGDEKTWADIMNAWPILLTADTLLSLQAMLRLLVLISNVLRTTNGCPTPLSKEAAAISCGAALGRALLLIRCSAYMLEGPLGGYLPAACELLSVPLLAMLSRGMSRRALVASVCTLAVAARIAHRNRLTLANDVVSDGLFIFAHIAELLAAYAYLSRALLLDSGCVGKGQLQVALRFSHIVMPVQQCLAAYYFVQAFEFVPQLVGVGHPFEILQVGGVVQLGAYAGAAVLHWAECLERRAEASEEGTEDELSTEPIEDASPIDSD